MKLHHFTCQKLKPMMGKNRIGDFILPPATQTESSWLANKHKIHVYNTQRAAGLSLDGLYRS